MRTPVEIGVLGTGARLVRLLRALEDVPRANLRWVCDPMVETRLAPVPHRRARVREAMRLDDMLLDEALDAVVIATPVATRYELAWAALTAEKHVLLDAPATDTSEQSDRLVETALQRARCLMVLHPLLFDRGIQKLKELIVLGRLGELYYLRVDRCSAPADGASGGIWTLCGEPLAVLPYLLDDEPVEVAARAASYADAGAVELLVCHFRFATGITAQLHASSLESRPCSRLAVVGSRGMAVFDELESERRLTVYDRASGAHAGLGSLGEIVCPQLRDGDPLVLALEDFVDRVREASPVTWAPGDGTAAVRLIEALQQSIEEGGATVPIGGRSAAVAPVLPFAARRRSWK